MEDVPEWLVYLHYALRPLVLWLTFLLTMVIARRETIKWLDWLQD